MSKTGSARNTRQKALAKGPTSENLTNTGETPMAMAPITNAAKAIGMERGGNERNLKFFGCKGAGFIVHHGRFIYLNLKRFEKRP